jgi:hypothetical protein
MGETGSFAAKASGFAEENSSTISGNDTTWIVAGLQAISELAPVMPASKTASFSDGGTLADG